MKLSKKEVTLLVVMIFLISGAVYYYYFLTPKLAELRTVTEAVLQKEQQVQQMNLKIAGIDGKRQEIQALQQELISEEQELPIGISQELQLVSTSRLIRDYVTSPTIKFNPGSDTRSNYQINLVELTFETTYNELLTVLEEFEANYHTNQIVAAGAAYTGSTEDYYVLPEEALADTYTDLSVTMILEFFTFYRTEARVPLEEQDFETSYVEEKPPFSPVTR